ncbi:elicitin [Phytophthora sojae]|uniref:Elicitin n=2 Tax=Phytophthora sojae TaxID=67593 RepID=G4ZXH5_PHYSP|nr:elicitin [Phytophthora sojae]ABB55996.1 putative elicitin protein SOJ3A [Phytophthora sojae]EGZ11838.1 elicitin [Phytophthora sojae]|eukprot:XP_009532171.1 elicitin [Phytophthora sojae]
MNAKTVAAAAFVGSVAADTCSSSQQTSAYTTLASLLTLDSFQGCVDDSGYSLLYSTSLPTDAEYVEMCASSNCQSLIESIIALSAPDCTLTVPTSGLEVNVYELANGFSAECSSVSSTTSTTSTASSTSTESTTTAPTATTAATTTTAATSTASSSDSTTTATTAPTATTAASSNSTTTTTTTITSTATAC